MIPWPSGRILTKTPENSPRSTHVPSPSRGSVSTGHPPSRREGRPAEWRRRRVVGSRRVPAPAAGSGQMSRGPRSVRATTESDRSPATGGRAHGGRPRQPSAHRSFQTHGGGGSASSEFDQHLPAGASYKPDPTRPHQSVQGVADRPREPLDRRIEVAVDEDPEIAARAWTETPEEALDGQRTAAKFGEDALVPGDDCHWLVARPLNRQCECSSTLPGE